MASPFVRRLGRVLLIAGTAILTLVVVVLASLQVPAIATWAANRLVALVPLSPGYELQLGRVHGTWVTGLAARNLRLRSEGRDLALIQRLRLEYDLTDLLLGPDRRLEHLVVEGGSIRARRTAEGWDLADAFQSSGDTATGGGAFIIEEVRVHDVGVTAWLTPDSAYRARDLTFEGRDLFLGDTLLLALDTLHTRLAPPGEPATWFDLAAAGAVTGEVIVLDPIQISTRRSDVEGRLVLPRSFDDPRLVRRLELRLRALPLALADLSALVPSVASGGMLRAEVVADGDGRLVTARLAGRLDEATLNLMAAMAVGRSAPSVVVLDGDVRRLDPSRLIEGAPAGRMTGEVSADLRGETLALADGSAALKLHGSRVGATEVRELELTARVLQGRAEVELSGELLGGSVRGSGWVRPFDSVPSYRLGGDVVGLEGTRALARALAPGRDSAELSVGYEVGGQGVAPNTADLEGRVTLAAIGGSQGREPLGHAAIALEEGRLEVRPDLLVAGGRVTALATAIIGDTVTYRIRRGRIDSVDLGRLLGDTVLAPLSARFRLDGQGLDPQQSAVTARVEVDDVRYGERRLERAVADVRLTEGRATTRIRGIVQEGRLALDAVARPFDSVTSFTVRRAVLDSVDLGTFLGRPELAGPVSAAASARGRWGPGVRSADARLTLAPSRVGTISLTDGEVEAAWSGDRLTYEAAVRTKAGAVSLQGGGSPLDEVPSYTIRSGRADSLDLGILLGRDSLTTALDARFEGLLRGTGLDSMLARLEVELLPSRVNQAQLGPGHLTLAVKEGRLEGDVRLQGGDAALQAGLRGRIGADSSRVRAEGELRVERLARWGVAGDHDGRIESRFDLTAAMDSAGLETVAGAITAAGGLGDLRLGTLHVALGVRPGAIRVDTLVLRSNVAALDGGGTVPLRTEGSAAGGDTLRIAGQLGQVQPLAGLAGLDSIFLDSASVMLRVTGPPEERQLNGRLDVFRLLYGGYGGTLAERATVRVAGTADTAGIRSVTGDLRMTALATGQVTFHDLFATARYDSLAVVQAALTVDDATRIALDGRGHVEGDTTFAELRRLQFIGDGRTWNLAGPVTLAIRPEATSIEELVLVADTSRRIAIDGVLSTQDTSDLRVEIRQFDLDALARNHLVPFGGNLNAAFRLSGPAEAPSAVGRLNLLARQDDRVMGRLTSEVEWTNLGLQLRARAMPRTGGRLVVEGELPWSLTLAPEDTSAAVGTARAAADTMSLVVTADSFDLGFFQPFLPDDVARELTGVLTANARVGGTPEQPQATGPLTVRGLQVTLPTIGVTYAGSRLDARFQGERLVVDSLRLNSGDDGRLVARGAVLLEPVSNPSIDLRARLDEFQVSNSELLESIATGDLRLTGTLEEPSLTGELELGPTEIVVAGEGSGAGAVEPIELTDADLRQVALRFGPGAISRHGGGPGFVDRFRLNVTARFPGQVWFRKQSSPSVNIELEGRISIRQQPGQGMGFFGTVRPIPRRGEMDIYGRRFEIVDGEITLQGPPEATRLDVTAEYQVPAQGDADAEPVVALVEATGQLDSLELEFSADPPMSNEDIISYIVTGRPASENPLLAENAEGGVDASQVAINQVVGTLGGAVGEELGFDVFQIRQETGRGLVLTAGQYVLPQVFVSLQQPLRTGPTTEDAATGATGPGFELEYSFNRWLRASFSGGSLPASALLRGRYGF